MREFEGVGREMLEGIERFEGSFNIKPKFMSGKKRALNYIDSGHSSHKMF